MFPEIAELDGDDRVRLILSSGLLETSSGAEARALGELALRSNDSGLEQIEQILRALRQPLPLSVLHSPREDRTEGIESWQRDIVDPQRIELALSLDVPLQIPLSAARSFTFAMHDPQAGDSLLERVAAHPFFGEVLIASFLPSTERAHLVSTRLVTVASLPSCHRVFSAIDDWSKTIVERFTLGAFEAHESYLETLLQPAVLERCSHLAPAVRGLSAARMLGNQLRAGLLDEWEETDATPPEPLDPATRWPHLVPDADESSLCAVEAGGPLPVLNGRGGGALCRVDGALCFELIDGQRLPSHINGQLIAGVMTFPEREGRYPVLGDDFCGVCMPDGSTPLVPTGHSFHAYWAEKAHDWYALRVRDRAGSRALSECTDEQAAQLVANPQALVFPEVTHPKLRSAITAIATRAKTIERQLELLRCQLFDEPIARSTVENDVSLSLYLLVGHGEPHWGTEEYGLKLGQQMLDVSHYLLKSRSKATFVPARTQFPWEMMLSCMGELIYRVLAPGTTKWRRDELVKVLELWLRTDFPKRLSSLRMVDVRLDTKRWPLFDADHSTRLITSNSRCFIRFEQDWQRKTNATLLMMGRSLPKGVTLFRDLPIDTRFDAESIESALTLLQSRGPVPFDVRISQAISKKTGLSIAAATLAWTAGYEPWMIGLKKRADYGIDRASLDVAEQELMPLQLRTIYAPLMPADPASLYDGETIVRRFTEAWPPPFVD